MNANDLDKRSSPYKILKLTKSSNFAEKIAKVTEDGLRLSIVVPMLLNFALLDTTSIFIIMLILAVEYMSFKMLGESREMFRWQI